MKPGVNTLNENVDLLLARLRIAAAADKRGERRTRIFGVLTIVLIVAFVGACDLIVDTIQVAWPFKALAITLLIVLVLLVARRWVVSRSQDLDDRKLQTTQKVLGILRADIPKDALVALTVDLRGYRTGGEVVKQKGSVTLYRHAWLTLSVPLADGNTISLGITDRVKRKTKRKRSREQYRSDVDLALRMDKRYGDAADVVHRLRQLPAPKPLRVVTVAAGKTVDGRARRFSARLSTQVPLSESEVLRGDAVLGVVRWAYAGLVARGAA